VVSSKKEQIQLPFPGEQSYRPPEVDSGAIDLLGKGSKKSAQNIRIRRVFGKNGP